MSNSSATDAGASPSPVGPDVIVFVPGLGEADYMGPAHVAELLRWEMDQRAADKLASFVVKRTSVDTDVVHRIERVDADVATPVVDLYCLKPTSILEGDKAPAAAARRAFVLALTVAAGILIWCAAWFRSNRRAKSFPQMLQLFVCLLILLLLGAYFLTALYALIGAIAAAAKDSGGGPSALIKWPQWVVLAAAVANALLPNIRERLVTAAELYRRVMRYLWTSGVRNQLTGHLQSLVDRINRRPEVQDVHLLGFSFGALVVLDTAYPACSTDTAKMQQVRSLITIGCPFDVVRMLNPSYAEGRVEGTAHRPRWINVYEPIDVLASNFNDGDGVTETAQRGVVLSDGEGRVPDINKAWNERSKLNLVNLLMLQSLAVHAQYWDRDSQARTALGSVVAALYGQTQVLR